MAKNDRSGTCSLQCGMWSLSVDLLSSGKTAGFWIYWAVMKAVHRGHQRGYHPTCPCRASRLLVRKCSSGMTTPSKQTVWQLGSWVSERKKEVASGQPAKQVGICLTSHLSADCGRQGTAEVNSWLLPGRNTRHQTNVSQRSSSRHRDMLYLSGRLW